MKLNIQLFASGTITFGNWDDNTPLRGKIEWSSEPNVEQNKSVVTANIYAKRTSGTTKGRQWNGYIEINNNEYDFDEIYTSTSTTIGTSWVLIETYTQTVTHESDGSKRIWIGGSINGPAGTSLAGEGSWGGSWVELDTLHTSPKLNYVGFTEENNTLLNLGVTDTQFVPYLSKKNISMNITLSDNAILSSINWRFRNIELDTLEIVPILAPSETPPSSTDTFTYTKLVDFTNRNLAYTQVGNKYYSKVGYSIIDSMSSSYVTNDSDLTQYEVIPYQLPLLVSTLTTAKRDGQTSGKVNLNVNGTFFNNLIGTTANEITVKYKFWDKQDTEPSTYITIPSSSVTISGNNISVSNYAIGDTDPTASNYFDYQKSYYVKVIIEDITGNIGTLNENLSIPKGYAIWSEYIDKVDFYKITRNKKQIYANYYTTEEHPIGSDKDGNEWYRRQINITTLAGSNNVVFDFNYSEIKKIYGFTKQPSTNILVPISYYNSGGDMANWYFRPSNSTLIIRCGSSYGFGETTIYVEYIK